MRTPSKSQRTEAASSPASSIAAQQRTQQCIDQGPASPALRSPLQQGQPPGNAPHTRPPAAALPSSCTQLQFCARAAPFLVGRLSHACGGDAATLRLRPGLQQLHDALLDDLDAGVREGRNTSLLVIGDPGSGKTLLLERVLRELCGRHNAGSSGGGSGGAGGGSSSSAAPAAAAAATAAAGAAAAGTAGAAAAGTAAGEENPTVGVVRLSGALHCDERAAFVEIARQLCRCGGLADWPRACLSCGTL